MATLAMQSPRRVRAEEHFKAAASALSRAIPKELCEQLGPLDFPNFERVDAIVEKTVELENFLEKFLQARRDLTAHPKRKGKFGELMLRWLKASYPFASTFFTVAKEGSPVHPSRTKHY